MPGASVTGRVTWLVRRAFRAGPHAVLRRLRFEVRGEMDRYLAPHRARLSVPALLRATGCRNLDALWDHLSSRPYPAQTAPVSAATFDALCPGGRDLNMRGADAALAHRVDLLGSGPVDLGRQIDWHRDYKTGWRWPPEYFRRIDYANLDRPSDVKVPWEISRMQWMIPLGQAYLLSGDERYAAAVRDLLADWIGQNPYAYSVNWRIAMEPAMRLFTWTWFFHVFARSEAWKEERFRECFLSSLFLHAEFVDRHIEHSEVNGNHCTADAAALVTAALFWGRGRTARRWLRHGWSILQEELPRQVFPDGVDFEASVPYHRLVLELFFFPARYRELAGLPVPDEYQERLIAMARFSAAYTRPDGTVPLWGDADDARVLPFGFQSLNDHRYLPRLVGLHFGVPDLAAIEAFGGEDFWLLGPEAAEIRSRPATIRSQAFPEGGFFVMRNDRDHVFIDCGPLGLAGRGGHGHNDCLSFEAVLDGVHLISDCGAFVYTASCEERNRFRSTAYHNTPIVDGEEINRFIRPDYLWALHNDAIPHLLGWETSAGYDQFTGSHSGYQRLQSPVTPTRTIVLDHASHVLQLRDRFEGEEEHSLEIPLHLAPGVSILSMESDHVRLCARDQEFVLAWNETDAWQVCRDEARVSPGYGVTVPITRLCWRCKSHLPVAFELSIAPRNAVSTRLFRTLPQDVTAEKIPCS